MKMADAEGVIKQRFLDQKHAGILLSRLNELRQKEKLCDVTILVNGSSIKAHRAVLAASSQYFNAMFTSQLSESSQNMVSRLYTNDVFFIYCDLVIDLITFKLHRHFQRKKIILIFFI